MIIKPGTKLNLTTYTDDSKSYESGDDIFAEKRVKGQVETVVFQAWTNAEAGPSAIVLLENGEFEIASISSISLPSGNRESIEEMLNS